LDIYQVTKIFRQTDPIFISILNEMRVGKLSENSVKTLNTLSREVHTLGLKQTKLFPLRKQVEEMNRKELSLLPGETMIFIAADSGSDPIIKKKLNDSVMCAEILELKLHAQVMLIKNLRQHGLYNGCVGKVTKIIDDKSIQIEFEVGSANSPVKRSVIINRETFEVDVSNGKTASRNQFPLILAYAMSIHKAQGQTLKFVHVDLERIFEKGQAYVAMSRCTSLEGLTVKNFDPSKVEAHPKVKKFHIINDIL
jgi:ATP-dependent DNA helicase PIF1